MLDVLDSVSMATELGEWDGFSEDEERNRNAKVSIIHESRLIDYWKVTFSPFEEGKYFDSTVGAINVSLWGG